MTQRPYKWVYVLILVSPLFAYSLFPFPFLVPDTLKEEVPAQFREYILRYNSETLSVAWELTQDLLRKEDERFRHIDTKTATLMALLAVAIGVVGSIGALVIQQDFIKGSPKYFKAIICILWASTFIFFAISFSFALQGTRVIVKPAAGGYRAIPPKAILGPDRVIQDEISYKKSLLTEEWEVIFKNVEENNRKALNLLRSQTMVFYASLPLFWLVLLFSLAFIIGPPPELPKLKGTVRSPLEKIKVRLWRWHCSRV